MKKNIFWMLSAVLLLTACGGGEESSDSEKETDAAPEETGIEYGPFMTTEEVVETDRIESIEDFNAIEDKSTVIRYVSSEYNDAFPAELMDAYNLQVLSINVQGELPEDLGKFQNMTTLVLTGKMTKLPESVGDMERLKVVSFEACKELDLEQAFGVLANCPNIEYMSLNWMELTEIPDGIGDFKKLKHLRIGSNSLTTLPESLYSLPALEHMRIGKNEGMDYEAVLASAKNLPVLSTLWLQYCGFESLPNVLGEYPALLSVHWRENWPDKDGDQIIAICEKEGAKFENLEVSWSSMSGMLYDVY
jgi:Leucine-rich repeat (LRR) protein